MSIIKKITPFILLIVVGFLVYYPILSNQFLDYWDDQWVVMNHYTEGGINFQNIWNILTEFYHGQYAPFNEFLYLFLYTAFGYNPFVFHLASLIIHVINSCLVFILLKKILVLSGKVELVKVQLIAFITAFIFCIHPFNVESVAWMSASKIIVYALFYFLATYTFLLFLERGKIRYYIYTIILFTFSFFGKEQAVVFPLWLVLLYWIANYRLSDKKIWIYLIPFFILSIAFGLITIYSQYADGGGVLSDKADYLFWQRIVFACYSWFEYIWKTILPFKLSYLYPFPSIIGEPLPNWLLFYPVFLIIVLTAFWKFLKQRPLLYGLLFFTIHLAVALHIIPLSHFVIVADRYAYISVVGITFIISYYTIQLYNYVKTKKAKSIILVVLSSYLLYFGIYAHKRTYTWYNVDTLKKEIRGLIQEQKDDNNQTNFKNDF